MRELYIEPVPSLASLREEVSAELWEESERLRPDTRRAEWLFWRMLLNRALPGAVARYNDVGAPEVEGAFISVAHCPGYAALLVSDRRCAVDIERRGREVPRPRRFFTPSELSLGLDPLVLWCAKEALYKYAGVSGLDLYEDLHVLSFSAGRLTGSFRGGPIVEMQLLEQKEVLVVAIP